MISTNKNYFFYFFALLSLITVLASCSSCWNKGGDKIPDVSDIKLEVKINRFDQDLMAIDTNNIEAGISNLKSKYPMFMEIYPQLIADPNHKDETMESQLADFIKHKQIRNLFDSCQLIYRDMSEYDKEFTQAFKYYKYYFPKKVTPQVVSYISEYGVGAFPYGDSLLAVGVDFFLGENHLGYGNLDIPRYVLRGMNKEHLVARTMEALVNGMIDESAVGKRLIDVMIDNGKKLYILDKLLPFTPDSVKLAYTQKQVDWCNSNEAELWSYVLSDNLLYSVKSESWSKLVNASPSGTTKMPADSPGRAGNWLGMKIVKAYMQRMPNTSFEQLIALKDAQSILDKSKYKPRRK
ncbi:MAG: hypothetical protein ACOYOA_15280 [Saprospiraceae bacterium]